MGLKERKKQKNKWFMEIIQDCSGTYCVNLIRGGEPVTGLPEHVDYKTLKEAVRTKTGICIPNRNALKFQQEGRKKYAFIDATQPLENGCVVTLDDIKRGHRPDFP